MSPQNELRNAALDLAAAGLRIHPCHGVTKRPLLKNWPVRASNDARDVAQFWRQFPNALPGIVTGAANGVDVLDIDPRNGGAAWWNAHRQNIPPTFAARTRSGGWHLYFRHRDGIRNSASLLGRGVDVRAAGGFVIGWFFVPQFDCPIVADVDAAPWPDWLAEQLLRPRTSPPRPLQVVASDRRKTARYVATALAAAADCVTYAAPGTRNDTLFQQAFTLSRLCAVGLDQAVLTNRLRTAALMAGLEEAETDRTIQSALATREQFSRALAEESVA